MAKEVETCEKKCKHEDCIYRRTIMNSVPICFYAVIEGETRKCSISKCTHYRTGQKKAKSREDYILWENIYDDDYI